MSKGSKGKKPGKPRDLTIRNSTAEFLIFTQQAGGSGINVLYEEGTVWLTQKLIAELFGVTVPTVNEHLANIFQSDELQEASVIRKFRITAADGKNYQTWNYNLAATIGMGHKVKAARAVQFCNWVSGFIEQFTLKAFLMDDERNKSGGKDE